MVITEVASDNGHGLAIAANGGRKLAHLKVADAEIGATPCCRWVVYAKRCLIDPNGALEMLDGLVIST